MIFLTEKNNVVKNIVTLVSASRFPYSISIKRWHDLNREYRKFLNAHSSVMCDEDSTQPTVIVSETKIRRLMQKFGGSEILDDLNQGTVMEVQGSVDKRAVQEKLEEALAWLQMTSEDHHAVFNLVITDFLVASSDRARGGSTSDVPGCIWIADITKYEAWEVAEILVHELVHNLVFLDELQHGHYEYSLISKPENLAISSILKIPRPVDKVFHSIVVATELLLYRQVQNREVSPHRVHPPTPILIDQLIDSINSLCDLTQRSPLLLTARANDLLDRCIQSIKTMSDATRTSGRHAF